MALEPINQASFDDKIRQANQPLVIDFWLADCPPCQMLEPRLETIAQAFDNRVSVYRLDIEKNPSIPERYNIMSIPTLLFFRHGEVVKRLDGLITHEDLKTAFDEVSA